MIKKLITIFLIIITFNGFSQNRIELISSDCSQENGFTMFKLGRANPKILTTQVFENKNDYWGGHKKIIYNQSDSLKIEYSNIFGQRIDTIFTNAKHLEKISVCVNKFSDYPKNSLIKKAIDKNKKWTLISSWGHSVFESDKLVFNPGNGYLRYKYYKNNKRISKGKIQINKQNLERIHLFEKKMRLVNNPNGDCNSSHSFEIRIGDEKIKILDYGCVGFSSNQLLEDLKIAE
ncbi:hypothetical protein [Aequorivita marina]|uniref:hypothetical protein n=1 Tax=Aequorivita marina TaxID=3073654 RepID=UPI002875220F|nr:hypothetical protein [Aequorivita sp. S2608]MDS1299368.1 hypothetical protein [Aequorivita sp. S2608]